MQQKISVVGGTYVESCDFPYWYEIYGSGGRAVGVFLELGVEVDFYSYLSTSSRLIIESRKSAYSSKLNIYATPISQPITFGYPYPLGCPTISNFSISIETIQVKQPNANFLVFGMLESDAIIHGNKVVYDPQNPVSPKSYTDNGSSAKQLALILNLFEAKKLVQSDVSDKGIEAIGMALLNQADVVVIKMGAEGAAVFDKISKKVACIPCYSTNRVWKIGTGDVFSASFAYAWIIKEMDPVQSAQFAAKATAYYANTKTFLNEVNLNNLNYPKVLKQKDKLVYLAGPFFNPQQLWLINECRRNLHEFGFKVFSPYHDVGPGPADQVVSKDLAGIDDCDIMFALLDDMDPGTLFEIGYAKAKGKTVVIYISNHNEEYLKMMQGTDCLIFNELTSAIYNAYWAVNQ